MFYATQFVLPLPPGHRFPMAKYALLREALAGEPDIRLQQALPASDGELALVHTPAYIDAIEHGTLPPALQREIGFSWSPATAERARRSVGATIQACRVALAGEGGRPISPAAPTMPTPTRAGGSASSTMRRWRAVAQWSAADDRRAPP